MSDRNKNRTKKSVVVTHGTGVYDLTTFSDVHPGGRKYLDGYNKKDITEAMNGKTHKHGPFAMRWMAQYRVGFAEDYPELETPEFNMPKNDGYVDWSKALFWQVGDLKEKYCEWLEIPTDRKLRLFRNDFCEYFSNTQWYMVPLVWLPVTYYLFTRCLAGGFSIPMSLIFLFIGIIWWTFTEYVMHRFLFHLEPFKNKGSYLSKVTDNWTYITIHFLFHGQHHKVPFDKGRLVFPVVPAGVFIMGFRAMFQILCGSARGDGIMAGGVLGYICYDMIHYFTHHGSITKGSFLDRVRRYHIGHHFVDPDSGYGISSSLWDWPFQTAPKKKY